MSFGSPFLYLPEFEYLRPKSIDEALEFIQEKGEDTRIMAGGVGLISFMKERLVSPKYVLDLKGIQELRGLSVENGEVRIGACTTFNEILVHEAIKEFRSLYIAIKNAADPAIRSRATIGGNVCEAIPWVDTPAPLIAHSAVLEIRSKKSTRYVEVEKFIRGMLDVDLAPNEIVTSVLLKRERSRSNFVKFSRGSEFSIASIAVSLAEDGVRVVYGSCSAVPQRVKSIEELIMKEGISQSTIRKASSLAYDEVECMEDVLASSSYRKNVVSIITARALSELL